MCSIRNFFDQDIVVTRLKSGSGHTKSYQSTATVDGHIQELSDRARQTLGILEERAWHAWFDVDTNIKEQDRLTDKDGKVYVVREITKKEYEFSCNQHLEVLLEEQNE